MIEKAIGYDLIVPCRKISYARRPVWIIGRILRWCADLIVMMINWWSKATISQVNKVTLDRRDSFLTRVDALRHHAGDMTGNLGTSQV